MARNRQLSLRNKLLATILTLTLLASSVTVLVSWYDARREVNGLLDTHLAKSARLLIAQSGHELWEIDLKDLRELAPYDHGVAFQVWDQNGVLVLKSADAPGTRFSGVEEGLGDALVGSARWRVYSGWDRARRAFVQVAEPYAVRDRIARQIAINTLLPSLILLPLLALALSLVVARTLRPLEELGREVARRRPQALAPIPEAGVPLEALPLIQRLNELFARVSHSFEQERRFTANAAHELRNPLAGLRAQAEVARSGGDLERTNAALDQVIVACDRLTRLVEQLLLLARLEEQAMAPQRCSIEQIAREVVASLAPDAIAHGHDLGLEVSGPALEVSGNATLLTAMLRNLVDNALRHGGDALRVTVRVTHEEAQVKVSVEDDGRGVGEEALADLGERFRRPEGTIGTGSGLGLALVKRIAEVHGGRMELFASGSSPGFRATVYMPRSAAP